MQHEDANRLLSDFVLGELAGERAREVEQHCAECADCAAEVALIRDVIANGPIDVAGSPSRLRPRGAGARAGFVAAACVAALLAYPSYLGLVRYPQALKGASTSATSQLVPRGAGDAAEEAPLGASVLVLEGPRRAPADVPVYRVRPGQRWLPLQFDCVMAPNARAADEILCLMIRSANAPGGSWSRCANRAALWDEGSRCVSVLVPVDSLPAGELHVSLARGEGGPLLHESRFRLERESPLH